MRKRLNILFILPALLMLLLSTMVVHHHHLGQVCMVVQECDLDGNDNDEHTGHHDYDHHAGEQSECQVQQMQHFIISARTPHTLIKYPAQTNIPLLAILQEGVSINHFFHSYSVSFKDAEVSVTSAILHVNTTRGSPCLV